MCVIAYVPGKSYGVLLIAEGIDGIDMGGAAGGKPACQERDHGDGGGDGAEDDGVVGFDLIEELGGEAREGEGKEKTG